MSQQRIGRYQVLEDIAVGGQGAVYKAFDPLIDRIVAVKVLKPELTSDGGYLERFYREAAMAAQIDHPNVVKIHDMGEDDGRHFIVMEYLPRTLADLIPHDKGLPIDRALELGGQIAEGLAAAHARGITHRDVKPQNVLITQDGDAKVTDFGIARAETFTTMTLSGAIIGTPHYMSPEQARGTRVDVRSDVYSLGCVIYEMLTGRLPFSGNTPYEVFRQHVEEQPRPVHELRREVPRELAEVVERAMGKDPDDRYQSAGDLAEAIRSVAAGSGRQARAARSPSPPTRPSGAPPSGASSGASARPEAPVPSSTKPSSLKRPLAILGASLSLEVLQNSGNFLLLKGFQRQGKRRITTWAILAAHAASPGTHKAAQANAIDLLKAESPEKADIRNYHPCVALGVPAARRYFVDQGRITTLAPFQPACIDHMVEYQTCTAECVYGVLYEGQWVHEILRQSNMDRTGQNNSRGVESFWKVRLGALLQSRKMFSGGFPLTQLRRFLRGFRES